MGRNLDDVIKSLPTDRQAKIATLSGQKVEEMIAHAATLAEFRKAVGRTQVEVAKELGINQNAVSQLENRSDTYVSTLRRFLKSLGMKLELSVVAKDGRRIDLPNFLPGLDADFSTSDGPASVRVSGRASAKAGLDGKVGIKASAAKAAPARKAVLAAKSVTGRTKPQKSG